MQNTSFFRNSQQQYIPSEYSEDSSVAERYAVSLVLQLFLVGLRLNPEDEGTTTLRHLSY